MTALAAPAAIAALLQLADYGTRLASIFYSTARSAGAAQEELERLADRLQLFSATVTLTRDTLKRHCAEYPQSPVVLFIEHKRILRNVKRGSTSLRRRLRDSGDRLQAMYSSSALWMSIKWVFKRSSFLEMLPELDGFQANLSLLVAVANLEALNELKKSGVVSKVLEDEWYVFCGWICRCYTNVSVITSCTLQSSIKTLLKTIERLQSQLDQFSRPQQEPDRSADSAPLRGRGQRDPLLRLARSMYSSGVVPKLDSSPATPAPSDRGFGQCTASRRNSDAAQGSGNSNGASSLDQASFVDSALPHDESAPRESCSSQQHAVPLSCTTPQDSNSPPLGTNASSKDGLAPKILHLDRDYSTGAMSGYVKSSYGTFQPATAVIHRTLDGNVISMKEVRRLNLVVPPPEITFTGGANLVFGPSSSERSVGKVTLQWTRDIYPNKRYPPLAVECEVSESCQTELIFGRPFLQAIKRSWP